MIRVTTTDKAEIVRTRDKVDNVTGPRVRSTPQSIRIGETLVSIRKQSRQGPILARMIITDPDASTDVVLARFYDGTLTGEEDIAVKSELTHAEDDEIIAARPFGGTDKEYSGDPVLWREVTAEQGIRLFPVNVTQNGGANGSQSVASTYTYDCADLDANVLGTAMAPTMPRIHKGAVTAATKGIGYFDSVGDFVLYDVREVFGVNPCP